MDISNPSRDLHGIDVLVSRVDLRKDAIVGLLLPTAAGIEAKGARLEKLGLTNEQQRFARDLKVNSAAFFRILDASEAEFRLPVPPGETWRLGLVHDVGALPLGTAARFSIISRQGDKVLGGNTYIVRSTNVKR